MAGLRLGSLGRLHEHVTPAGALVHELDGARDLGEERIVFAAPCMPKPLPEPRKRMTRISGSRVKISPIRREPVTLR